LAKKLKKSIRRLTITDPGWWDMEYRAWFKRNVVCGPRTPQELARIRKRWAKITARKKRERATRASARALERAKASPKNRTRKVGQRRMDKLILAMDPGAWYSVGDLAALELMPRNSLNSIIHQKSADHGVLDKAIDVEWRGWTGGYRESAKHVYKLSERGERLRVLLELLE
jgi:hypothetical protein